MLKLSQDKKISMSEKKNFESQSSMLEASMISLAFIVVTTVVNFLASSSTKDTHFAALYEIIIDFIA